MAQVAPTHQPEPHTAFDHFEEEYRSLEGVTRWGGPIRVGAAVIIAVGLIGAGAWWLMTPPPSSVHASAYSASPGAPIEVMEPKRMTLANPPDRFAWDAVSGKLFWPFVLVAGAVGGAIFGNAGAGAAAGAVVGTARRANQRSKSYQFYYDQCMAR